MDNNLNDLKTWWLGNNRHEAFARRELKRIVAMVKKHEVDTRFAVGSQNVYCLMKNVAAWNADPSKPFTLNMTVTPQIRKFMNVEKSGLRFRFTMGVYRT